MDGSTDTKVNTLKIPGAPAITWDNSDPATVDAARAAFNQAKGQGMAAYAVPTGTSMGSAGSAGTVIRDFDPQAEEIQMVTQIVGG